MRCHDWYTIKEILGRLQVESEWVSSSNLLMFATSSGEAVIRKSNRIQPEMIQLMLDKLGIDESDFERAYQAQ